MASESQFQTVFIRRLRVRFKDIIILKNDPSYLQGVPDLTLFYGPDWAWLDIKDSRDAPRRPNQEYYISLANSMGAYGAFVYPENEGVVLNELQRAFRSRR